MWDGVTRGMGDDTITINPPAVYQAPGWQQGVEDTTPDTLDISSMTGPQAGPSLNPGINLSSGVVASEVAGGVPLNVQTAGVLGTSGSTANIILWVGAGVAGLLLSSFMKGGRRR